MLKLTRDDIVDIEEYESHLRCRAEVVETTKVMKHSFIYFDKEVFEKILVYNGIRCDSLYWFVYNELITRSGGACGITANLRDSMLTYLTKIVRISPELLKHKTSKTLSLNKQVVERLIERDREPDLLTAYLEYTSLKSTNGKRGFSNDLVETNEVNTLGHKLYKLHYYIEQQPNLRYNTSDVDVIGIPKIYNQCITTPKGSFIVGADSSQADFRAFLSVFVIDETNYEHFNNFTDSYEATEALMCKLEGTVYDRDAFLESRDLYKIYALETAYGTKQENHPKGKVFVERFNKFLNKCPRYVEYRRRLKLHLTLGISPVLTDYFGNERVVELWSKKTNKPSINPGLNAPIQQFTSDSIIMTVNRLLDKVKKLGLPEDYIQLYYPRHDEALFLVKDEAIPYLWIFKEFERVYIDNFYPLDFEFECYSQYGTVDDNYMDTYKHICSINEDKLTYETRDNNFKFDYLPVRDVLEVSVNKIQIPHTNNWVISLYYSNKRTADYVMIENVIEADVDEKIQALVTLKISEVLDPKEYSGVLVNSPLRVINECMVNEVYFKWENNSPITISKASILCINKLWQYCIREGIEYKPEPHILTNLETIEDIKRANYIKV